jgi:hypothetical protein
VTRWDDIKAKRAEQDPELYERIERERNKLTHEQVDRDIDAKRQDEAFMARIRAAIRRDKAVLDRLRDR